LKHCQIIIFDFIFKKFSTIVIWQTFYASVYKLPQICKSINNTCAIYGMFVRENNSKHFLLQFICSEKLFVKCFVKCNKYKYIHKSRCIIWDSIVCKTTWSQNRKQIIIRDVIIYCLSLQIITCIKKIIFSIVQD